MGFDHMPVHIRDRGKAFSAVGAAVEGGYAQVKHGFAALGAHSRRKAKGNPSAGSSSLCCWKGCVMGEKRGKHTLPTALPTSRLSSPTAHSGLHSLHRTIIGQKDYNASISNLRCAPLLIWWSQSSAGLSQFTLTMGLTSLEQPLEKCGRITGSCILQLPSPILSLLLSERYVQMVLGRIQLKCLSTGSSKNWGLLSRMHGSI